MVLARSPRLQATKTAPRAALLCLVISIALSAPCAVRGAQVPAASSIAAALSSAESPAESFNVSLLVLNATGLLAKLPALAPLTLFAPTDAAWRAAFHALALPYLSAYIPFPGPAVGGETLRKNGNSSGGAGDSDAANSISPAQPTPAPGVPPQAGDATSGGASSAMVPGLPQIDLPLPGVPDLPIPEIPGGLDGLNVTMPSDNMTLATPDFNMTMPNMTMPNMTMPGINITTPDFNWTFPDVNTSMPNMNPLTFNPLLAALSAVFSGDGTPASLAALAALAKERPEALQALSELLAYHVATTAALNSAAIAAQFTAAGDAGNLTTVDGRALWVNYNTSESAALLNAYSPAQRALISEGVSVGYDGTVYFQNGTTVAANGTVIFDPATSPVAVDSEGNTYFANGTVVSANGTAVSTNGTIDGPGLSVPPTVSSPSDMPPATAMPAPIDVPPATTMPIVLVEPIPRVMGGWGDWGNWGNWSAEAQQQWWGNATEWMNGAVPGLNVTASEYLAWLNASSLAWAAGFDAMWEQAGSDMNVARVVRADVMDSAGIVVHGVDGVLFPHFRDLPVLKGGAGGGEGAVPMPIAVPVVAPGGVANDSANGTGTNGTMTGGKPNDSVATGAGAVAGSSNSNSSSSGEQDAFKIAASGTPAPPAGSSPPSKSQSKAAAVPLLLATALSLVALL
ncbi:unnamed protein product [Closterium sp. Naga37s-1]|nr:unnamed protein product [Closterium sp. Naga37s-1]